MTRLFAVCVVLSLTLPGLAGAQPSVRMVGPRAASAVRYLDQILADQPSSVRVRGEVERRGPNYRVQLRVRGPEGRQTGVGVARTLRAATRAALDRTGLMGRTPGARATDPASAAAVRETPGGGPPVRLVVHTVHGRGAAPFRATLAGALEAEGLDVLSMEALGGLAFGPTDGSLASSREALGARLEQAEADAFVDGVAERRGSRFAITLVVRRAIDGAAVGAPIDVEAGSLRGLTRNLRRSGPVVADRARDARRQKRRLIAERAEPEPTPEPELVEDTEPSEDRRFVGLELEAGLRLFARRITYRDDIFQELAGYEVPLAPALRARLRLFPGALFSNGGGAHLGFEAEVERAVALSTRREDGSTFPTTSHAWRVGVLGRVPLGSHALFVGAGYGTHDFQIDANGPARPGTNAQPGVPATGYRFVRASAGAELTLVAGLHVHGDVGLRVLTSLGGIGGSEWFPNARGMGFDAEGGIGYAFEGGLLLRAGVSYRRYGFDLRPSPVALLVAGGAVDSYLAYDVTLGWRL